MKAIGKQLKEKIALLRLQQGDTEAFGFIYDSYIEKIYRYVYFRISDEAGAQDIAHEVFLAAWEYIVDKRTVENIQALLYRIAYNKVVDHYRAKERQAMLLDDLDERLAGSTELSTTELEMQMLRKKIRQLKPEYQDIITLRHLEGLSIREIAEVISKDSNNVRVTLHRAMTSLKELCEQTETTDPTTYSHES